MKKLLTIVLLSGLTLTACGSDEATKDLTPSVDSISAASTNAYYAESSLTGAELVQAFNQRLGAISIATTNEDGTPNLATAIPGMTEDAQYMYLSLAECQTLTNIKERKIAVIENYIYNKDATEKLERNGGARVVVTLVEDQEESNKVREDLFEKGIFTEKTKDLYMIFKVEKVLPIG